MTATGWASRRGGRGRGWASVGGRPGPRGAGKPGGGAADDLGRSAGTRKRGSVAAAIGGQPAARPGGAAGATRSAADPSPGWVAEVVRQSRSAEKLARRESLAR